MLKVAVVLEKKKDFSSPKKQPAISPHSELNKYIPPLLSSLFEIHFNNMLLPKLIFLDDHFPSVFQAITFHTLAHLPLMPLTSLTRPFHPHLIALLIFDEEYKLR
jgi:hypothetical protein